jgi:hypothetical protein
LLGLVMERLMPLVWKAELGVAGDIAFSPRFHTLKLFCGSVGWGIARCDLPAWMRGILAWARPGIPARTAPTTCHTHRMMRRARPGASIAKD